MNQLVVFISQYSKSPPHILLEIFLFFKKSTVFISEFSYYMLYNELILSAAAVGPISLYYFYYRYFSINIEIA